MITVPFTIPGEHVRARVRRLRDGTCIGVVDEILRPSAHRVAPHCPHFGYETGFDFRGSNAEIKPGFLRGCGGCSWQHIAYPEQLRLKSELVTRLLREAVPRAPAARPVLTATPADSPWGYRQKVHFVFGAGPGGSLAMGHYARGTRRVIPVAACPVHERLREEVAGVSFLISPTAFFQTNVRAADILARLVVDAIKPPARVLDLYAGAGLFALPLARAGSQVAAVEESREAIADGEASRRLNGIAEQQCQFMARRVEDAFRTLRQQFDAVILDPPRAGCSADVIKRVFRRLRPALAVYVSCNLEALARDSKAIVQCGYEIVSLQPVDMFPHTAHVETVAILRLRPDGRMTNRRGDRR